MTLGDFVNRARLEKGLGLRALARALGIVPSYLSDIENNRRVPSESVLRELAHVLDLDFEILMQRAGRLGEDAERYLRENRRAGQLFRRIAASQLDQDALEKLENWVVELDGPESEGDDDERVP